MPKIEDLERLGSIAFLIGNKDLPEEISQSDYDRFKSVFTDEHMANSMPAEDNDLPSIDDLDSLDDADTNDDKNSDDDLELPDLGDDKADDLDLDDLGLPEDLGTDDNLDLPKDLDTTEDEKVSVDTDNLDLPEDLDTTEDEKVSVDTDNLDLPEDLDTTEDEKVSVDTDNLDLPEDLDTTEDEKVSVNTDDLDLPEDLDTTEDEKVSVDTDDLDLPEDLDTTEDEKVSVDTDDLDLPEDLDNIEDEKVSVDTDDLDLPEDLDNTEDEKVSVDTDDLDLPEDLDNIEDEKVSVDTDDLDLPEDLDNIEDEKVSVDTDDLDLPEDLDIDDDLGLPEDLDIDDDKISGDLDSLDLPEDQELEDKIAMDINDSDSKSKNSDIKSDKLPVLDDLPLLDTLPNIDDDYVADSIDSDSDEMPEIKDIEDVSDDNDVDDILNSLDMDDISDSLDDILDEEEKGEKAPEEEPIPESKSEEPESKADDKEEEDDDLSLDNLIPEEDEEKEEEAISESKSEEPESKADDKEEDDDDLSLDNLIPEEDEEKEEEAISESKSEEPASKSDDKEEDDDLSLDNLIPEEEEKEEAESKSEEPESKSDDKEEEGDDLSLDNLIPEEDEEKEEESESKEEETESKEKETSGGDVDLDNLTLDDIDDTDNKSNEEETHDEDNHHDDLDLPDEIEDTLSDVPSTNIIEGGTTLPAPETSNSLVPSKYDDVDKDVDHDKVINAIKYLPPITQYHVLDAILNEKISRNSMEDLLNALERGESSENIANILNKELGLSIREDDRKNVLDLIPIPNSLKDYARIIRVAAVFLILFLAIVVFSFQFIYKPIMANKYYKQGLVSISNGAYDEAERNFAQGERLKPKQTKWYNRYARAYIARETFPNALNKIQGALNIKPRDFETRITYGFYYRKKGEKELSEEDYIAGEELYNDMLVYTKKKKEQKVIYDERGVLMISRAKNLLHPEYYDLAYNNYSDMINFFGDDVIPRKRTMLIRIYQDNYQHVKALQNHIENLKKGYIDDDVYPKLAKYLLDKDDFYGSRTLFEKLLAAYPSNLESIVGYADYETRLKHYDRAMEILTTAALPLYSKDPFYRGKEYVYNMLGQIYYNLGEYGNAVKNFNEALSINSVYPDANYNLGNVYFYQDKDYVKAKEYYQMAYDNLAPNLRSDQLLYNLSWIYYLDSEFDRAFEGFNALFQKNPSNSVVSYALGNSLLHLDKANLANGFYRNALSQVLSKRDKLGRLEMRTESDFILISYLASLYNNIGVSYAYNSTVTNTIQNEQEAFKHFVLASEYFDQVRTSNIDLERMEKRTVMVDNQNVGAAAYNIMAVQGKRNLKAATIIDDYIPKDMYYLR